MSEQDVDVPEEGQPSQEELHRVTAIAVQAMAEAHDAKAWAKCVAVGDAWLDARGSMPAVCCIWYAQSLMGVGRYDDAVPWAEVAASNMPSETIAERIALCAARSTYAQSLARVGLFSKARAVVKLMVKTPVDHPETMEKQGHMLLAVSDKWRAGWAMHEHRASNVLPPEATPWNGQSRGTVAVLHEQGIGDAVLFARWLGDVAERSGHDVTWYGPEQVLGRWIADLPHVIVGDRSSGTVATEYAVFAMSLPHVLGCEHPSKIPAPVAPVSLRTLRIRHRVDPDALRVGVCWKGAETGWHDFERSFSVDDFAPIWSGLDGVEFVNLCHMATVPDSAPFVRRGFRDIYETGEVIVGLDLVVTVDTATAHIAGSLGVPTLAIVPTVPDWRYSWPGAGVSPFYASVTVLRRKRADDLRVIANARVMLERYAQSLRRKVA